MGIKVFIADRNKSQYMFRQRHEDPVWVHKTWLTLGKEVITKWLILGSLRNPKLSDAIYYIIILGKVPHCVGLYKYGHQLRGGAVSLSFCLYQPACVYLPVGLCASMWTVFRLYAAHVPGCPSVAACLMYWCKRYIWSALLLLNSLQLPGLPWPASFPGIRWWLPGGGQEVDCLLQFAPCSTAQCSGQHGCLGAGNPTPNRCHCPNLWRVVHCT